jgi:type II secretory pathway pseudopilin PulG
MSSPQEQTSFPIYPTRGTRARGNAGFTLVEAIAAFLILGLVAAAGTLGFTDAVRGFVFSADNIDIAQQAQNALNRLTVEMTHIAYNPSSNYNPPKAYDQDGNLVDEEPSPIHPDYDSNYAVGYEVTSSGTSNITFNAFYGQNRAATNPVAITRTGDQLLLNNEVLCDNVTDFVLEYYSDPTGTPASTFDVLNTRLVAVRLEVTGTNNVPQVFETRISPPFTK